ncbi:MAG: PaaI family thioesterase [Alphaproteobacteria bacterium]
MAAPEGPRISADEFNERARGFLPGYLGVDVLNVEQGRVTGRMKLERHHLAPNGFLHGGSVVAFADTLCGAATIAHLPEGAQGFTTIELKTNFFGTLVEGVLFGEAAAQHLGRSTQVWDVRVYEDGRPRTLALFRCTNMILYPGP